MLKVSKILQDPTESPAFQAWFAGSKVVDADGNPARIFHGTDKKFNSFNLKKTTQGIIWFTSDKASVEAGDVGAQGRGVIMELYACIKNPAGWKEYDQLGLGELKGRGYDGAILPEKDGSFTGFVFQPNQLKSVANKGSWDSQSHFLTAKVAVSSGASGGGWFLPDGSVLTLDGKGHARVANDYLGRDSWDSSTNPIWDGHYEDIFELGWIRFWYDSRGLCIQAGAHREVPFWNTSTFRRIQTYVMQHPEVLGGDPVVYLDVPKRLKVDRDSFLTANDPKKLQRMDNLSKVARTASGRSVAKVVFHGTPHDFDEFKLEHIGRGEGAQAYGWGLYFTEVREIADYYRDSLSQPSRVSNDIAFIDGVRLQTYLEGLNEIQNPTTRLKVRNAIANAKTLNEAIDKEKSLQNLGSSRAEVLRILEGMQGKKFDKVEGDYGHIYEVDIPDNGAYLLWDKPLSEQPEAVKKTLESTKFPPRFQRWMDLGTDYDGAGFYSRLQSSLESQRAASEFLYSIGIAGIQYLDGSSRDAGNGNYNYVIFNDKDVQVVRKNSPSKVARTASTDEIDPLTPYLVIDTQTGKIVGKYTYKNRNQARAFKDRKDQEYGAVRYVCKLGDLNA